MDLSFPLSRSWWRNPNQTILSDRTLKTAEDFDFFGV
ncbi:unnamed protein product [Spirodela intermedia]|uniref:Uncharacterized protein n=1 Tax=Spirodela intermedia TaxID=51605 RepID=A0A7I8J2P6_SPIIN|nr:unnamed protein product [Spirodela intermedia]CAA6664329.1 unnamed protein product [Spirodela intermedia]